MSSSSSSSHRIVNKPSQAFLKKYAGIYARVIQGLGIQASTPELTAYMSETQTHFHKHVRHLAAQGLNPQQIEKKMLKDGFATHIRDDFANREAITVDDAITETRTDKPYLGARILLPGSKTGSETVTQSVSDVAKGDLWNFRPENSELGVNNMLYLDNLQNQAIRLSGELYQPHTVMSAPDNLGHEGLPLLKNSTDVRNALAKAIQTAADMGKTFNTLSGPFTAISLLGGNVNQMDPNMQDKRYLTDMIPNEQLEKNLHLDLTLQPVPGAGKYMDWLNFRPDYSPYRNADVPVDYHRGADHSKYEQMYQVERNMGNSWLYGY